MDDMIANSIFILAIWGALGSILVSPKSNRLISFLTFVLTGVIFFFLSKNYLAGAKDVFSFDWLQYMSLQVDIDLSSNSQNYAQIFIDGQKNRVVSTGAENSIVKQRDPDCAGYKCC